MITAGAMFRCDNSAASASACIPDSVDPAMHTSESPVLGRS